MSQSCILLFLLLVNLPLSAQEIRGLKGYVLTFDNIPISDVHIYIGNTSNLSCISNTDGSFEMRSSVLEPNTVIHFEHISYKELSLSYYEILQAEGIVQMQESVRFLDQVTVHPLTAKQMFLAAMENMRKVSINNPLFSIHTTWKANAMVNDSIHIQSLLDSLNRNTLQIPILDTIGTEGYFDYVRSQAAVFNSTNQDDYSFEYVNSDTLSPVHTLIKCSNRNIRGNEFLVTVNNNDFSIRKVGFRYLWIGASHILTKDLRYRISTLCGESVYDVESKGLVSIEAKAVVFIGIYDSINRKFKPIMTAEKEYYGRQL